MPHTTRSRSQTLAPRRGLAGSDLLTALVLLLIAAGVGLAAYLLYAKQQHVNGQGEATALGELPPPSIETAAVEIREIAVEFRARGQLTPRREITLTSEVTARVVGRPVEIGASVEPEAVILELDAAPLQIQLDEAKANEARAQARLADTAEQLARARGSGNQRNIVDATNQQASARAALELAQVQRRQAERNFERRYIRSPIRGVVSQLQPNAGEFVAEGMAVGRVLEVDSLTVTVPLSAREVAQLDSAATFTFIPETDSEAGLPATLLAIAPQADLKSRTFAVQLGVENGEGRWRPGMFGEVRIANSPRAMLVVPWTALRLEEGGRTYGFLLEERDGKTMVRRVEPQVETIIGRTDLARVVSGLNPGDRLASGALLGLRDGAEVRIEGE